MVPRPPQNPPPKKIICQLSAKKNLICQLSAKKIYHNTSLLENILSQCIWSANCFPNKGSLNVLVWSSKDLVKKTKDRWFLTSFEKFIYRYTVLFSVLKYLQFEGITKTVVKLGLGKRALHIVNTMNKWLRSWGDHFNIIVNINKDSFKTIYVYISVRDRCGGFWGGDHIYIKKYIYTHTHIRTVIHSLCGLLI